MHGSALSPECEARYQYPVPRQSSHGGKLRQNGDGQRRAAGGDGYPTTGLANETRLFSFFLTPLCRTTATP